MFSRLFDWMMRLDCHGLLWFLAFVDIHYGSNHWNMYSTLPCTILSDTTELPCVQHVFIGHPESCDSANLLKLFPYVYSKPDSSVKYPGPVTLLESNYSNIKWRARKDGSVYFLKGFQVVQTGITFNTHDQKECAVIDISNLTETQILNLSNMTFTIDFKRPGNYSVEVKSLPLGNKGDVATTIDITQDPIYDEYHPEINVTFDYKQLNETCVNMSLVILPKLEDVNNIKIDILYNGVYFQNISGLIPYKVLQYLPLCDLSIGNYSMKISLMDDSMFTDGPPDCICYKGTLDAHTCLPECKKYTRNFVVNKSITPISTTRDGQVVIIIVTIVCPIIVVVIVTVVLFLLYRRKGKRMMICWKKDIQINKDQVRRSTVIVIYSNDHEAHSKAVQSFIQMIEATYYCSVRTLDLQNKQLYSDTLSVSDSQLYDTVKDCDVTIVIHSEYMHHLVSESNIILEESDRRQANDRCIIQSLTLIKRNSTLHHKTISLYFDYTDKSFVNLLGSECLFFLPFQLGSFRSHFVDSAGLTERTCHVQAAQGDEHQFISAVNRACLYQQYCPNWFSVKLFSVQTSNSSDDSGIIVTNRRIKRQRSVRSKSADTVCKCGMHQPISDCSNCNRSKPRRHSIDYSFCPPETVTDDVSVRLSLLESRLVAFNDRYDFILNNNTEAKDDEYDYVTLFGSNV